MFQNERNRILETYDQRKKNTGLASLYRWSQPDVLVSDFSRARATAKLLRRAGFEELHKLSVLDVGCGSGQWLIQLMQWGARPEKLHGIDLLEERVNRAKQYLPRSHIALTDGWPLPFDDDAFDLVFANTVVSSIHDAEARAKLADEMHRVCRTGGAILVYDFHINKPGSSDTRAVKKREMKVLFSGCQLDTQSIILAPPLNRRVAPISTTLAIMLEAMLPFLRTHVMYLIRPM